MNNPRYNDVPVISTDFFTWSKGDQMFVTDVSDLEASRDLHGLYLEPVFILESAKTGRQVMLCQIRVIEDEEGDVVAWEYHPSATKYDWKVVLYND